MSDRRDVIARTTRAVRLTYVVSYVASIVAVIVNALAVVGGHPWNLIALTLAGISAVVLRRVYHRQRALLGIEETRGR